MDASDSLVYSKQQSSVNEQLDAIQNEGRRLATESSKEIRSLRTSLEETTEQLKSELCLGFETEEARDEDISRLWQELRDDLQTLKSKLLAPPKESAVLRRLSYV